MTTEPQAPAPAPTKVSKALLKSKTLAVNIVIIAVSFLPAAGEWVKENPADTLCLIGAVNILLRLVTNSKLVLWKD